MTSATPLFCVTAALSALAETLALFRMPKAQIVPNKGELPILMCVRLQAVGQQFNVRGTDMDTALDVSCAADVAGAGGVSVNCKALIDALKDAAGETVTLRDTGTGVLLVQFENGGAVRLKTESQEFPADLALWNTGYEGIECHERDASEFGSDLAAVAGCISNEETRYYLNGVFFHRFDGGPLRLVATDGHKAAIVERDAPEGLPADVPDIILPKIVANWIARVGGKHGETIAVGWSASRFMVKYGRMRLYSKVIDGTFPDYHRAFGGYGKTGAAIEIDAKVIAREANAVTRHIGTRAKPLVLSAGEGFVTMVGRDKETGVASAVLDGTFTPDGDEQEICAGMNAGYLASLAKSFGKGAVVIRIVDLAAPMHLSSPQMPHLTCVLMPMRVDDALVYSPARLARLDRNPLEILESDGPALSQRIADGGGTALRTELGGLLTQAIDYVAEAEDGDRYTARVLVKKLFANWTGQPDPFVQRAKDAKAKASGATALPPSPPARTPEPINDDKDCGNAVEGVTPTQPVCAKPKYRTMQEFKAAAGVGSVWLLETFSPAEGWTNPREREIVTVKARSIGMVRPDWPEETKRRVGGAGGFADRSWFEFPTKDMWHATETSLVRTFEDGTPCIRFTPVEATGQDVGEDLDASIEARIAALEAKVAAPLTIEPSEEAANLKPSDEDVDFSDRQGEQESRQRRSPAHARAIQRAWDARRSLRSVRFQARLSRDLKIGAEQSSRYWREECMKLEQSVRRLKAVNAGRRGQVANLGQQLLIARNRNEQNAPMLGDKVTAIRPEKAKRVLTYPAQTA